MPISALQGIRRHGQAFPNFDNRRDLRPPPCVPNLDERKSLMLDVSNDETSLREFRLGFPQTIPLSANYYSMKGLYESVE
jgi:hypothetical protein